MDPPLKGSLNELAARFQRKPGVHFAPISTFLVHGWGGGGVDVCHAAASCRSACVVKRHSKEGRKRRHWGRETRAKGRCRPVAHAVLLSIVVRGRWGGRGSNRVCVSVCVESEQEGEGEGLKKSSGRGKAGRLIADARGGDL